MAKVRLSVPAVEYLDRMIVTHSLPGDTRLRVKRSLRVLEQFPRIGRPLEGRWEPMRFILGPWRWMLIIYSYEEPDDVVLIVAFQDARSSAAATHREVPSYRLQQERARTALARRSAGGTGRRWAWETLNISAIPAML